MTKTQEDLCTAPHVGAMIAAPRLLQALMNGLRQKCPACGGGGLFSGYLKRRDACPSCGESFVGLDADDGPAWLTIMIAGHVVVPLLFFLETTAALPYPVEAAILILVTTATVLLVLPFAKGLFIANLWWNERKSS